MLGSTVGVAAQLPEVREPAVGPLDGPSQAEGDRQLGSPVAVWSTSRDDQFDAFACAGGVDERVVVPAVEMHRVDVGEQTACRDRVERRNEQGAVTRVGSRGRPSDRHATAVGRDRPLPALFPRSVGFEPVPAPPNGALCWLASMATSPRSRPMIRSYAAIASSLPRMAWRAPTAPSQHGSAATRTVDLRAAPHDVVFAMSTTRLRLFCRPTCWVR